MVPIEEAVVKRSSGLGLFQINLRIFLKQTADRRHLMFRNTNVMFRTSHVPVGLGFEGSPEACQRNSGNSENVPDAQHNCWDSRFFRICVLETTWNLS